MSKLNSTNVINKKASSTSLASSSKHQQSQHSSHNKFTVIRESTSSVHSLSKSKSGSQSQSQASLKQPLQKSKSKGSLKEKQAHNKITNEIKDLLDKLVTYQGNQSLHSQSILTANA